MRVLFFFALLAALVTAVLAWEKEDHEIFDLVSAIEASEGKGTTFYSWLDVSSTASTAEIAKAYRKKSMMLHPDKNPNDKNIHERFARLGVVSTILRNRESRDRYDFFYKNGVPVWRGTGYYYSRFRPGLGSVLVFLVLVTSGFHYIVQHINYRNDIERIERVTKEAQLTAWGPKLIPIEGQRKVKVNIAPRVDDEGESVRKRLVDMVVDPQNVYILDPSGEMHLLDKSTVAKPAFTNTWFFALVKSFYQSAVDRVTGPPKERMSPELELDDGDESTTASEAPGSGTVTPKDGKPSGVMVAPEPDASRRADVHMVPVNDDRQSADPLSSQVRVFDSFDACFPRFLVVMNALRIANNHPQESTFWDLPDINGLIANVEFPDDCEPPAPSQHSSFSDLEDDISELILHAPSQLLRSFANNGRPDPPPRTASEEAPPISSGESKSSDGSKIFSRTNSDKSTVSTSSSGSHQTNTSSGLTTPASRSVLGKRKSRDSIDSPASAGPSKSAKLARLDDDPSSPVIISHSASHQRLFNNLRLPYGVQYEIARIAVTAGYHALDGEKLGTLQGLSNSDAVPMIPGLFGQAQDVVVHNVFAKEIAAKAPWHELDVEDENLAKNPLAGLGLSEEAPDWFGGKVHFYAKLVFEDKNKKNLKVILKSPELGPSDRFARRWGSERFLTLSLSRDVLNGGQKTIKFLQRPFILGDHVFRAFDAKDNNVFLVCTNEMVEGKRIHPTRKIPGLLSLREFFAWHNDLGLNPKQTMAKWASRFALGRSNSAPLSVMLFSTTFFQYNHAVSDSGSDMTDGAGLINKAGLRSIYHHYDLDTWPTAIQVRVAGAKGLLVMHPTDVQETPRIWLRPSQIKVKHIRIDDPALRTIDLLRTSHSTTKCRLPVETIINLAENGVKPEAFITLIENALVNLVTPLITWEGDGAMERLWHAVSRSGGVMSARLARQEAVLARLKGYSERDSRELEDDDEEESKDEPLSAAWWVDQISGCPSSLEETVMYLLDAGFDPQTCSVLRAKLQKIVDGCVARCIDSYRVDLPVGMSAMAFLVPDELGVLQEGEFFFKTSRHDLQTRDGLHTDILLGPALITRHPCKLPTDVQKWVGVDRPELRYFTDVIVLSVKGPRRAADYLAGGDLDGDKGLLIWQPELVDPFVNADLKYSEEPPELQEMQNYLLSAIREMGVVARTPLDMTTPETIRLAYMFCKTLDGAKTGLTVRPEVYKEDRRKFDLRAPAWKEAADKKKTIDMSNMNNLSRPAALPLFIMDKIHRHADRGRWGTQWGKHLKEEIDRKFGQAHVVDGDLTAPWLEFDKKHTAQKSQDEARRAEIVLLASHTIQADNLSTEAKEIVKRLLQEVEDKPESDRDRIKNHVEAVFAKYKSRIDGKFSKLPIRERQDILRELSRDFAAGPPGLSIDEYEAARIKASYAYWFDSDIRRKHPFVKWSRFPWDVTFRELCLIKARASNLKPVKSDFYERMTMKVK
ncbi:RNA-dependent RNA polymerase [Mycena sanguinolenta]|uniref:RNA-dependent RNA polymerase n=1 Tax=Mycena sanguinolenta TaxID=230812 RepID=A0A8H7D1L3_9AGAR|nr:RNA-dependent RNA polymerase [Mycena sanguinolenta]